MQQFGTLEPVDLRRHWNDEARAFTPWLASAENIGRLSETLGLDLEVEATEVPVGPYRADIVARDLASDQRVIIENQLEKTNHDHLGKIITYASGLEARTMIWIAREFSEEHRRALDFLNEHGAPELRIYGIEVQLWRIGDSLPAPLFKIVSSPNDYTAAVRQSSTEVTATENLYLQFWTSFKEYCDRSGTKLRMRKPQPRTWYTITIRHNSYRIYVIASRQRRYIGCEFYLRRVGAKAAFKALQQQQAAIESETGPLEWRELNVACSIGSYRSDFDVANRDNWPEAHRWLKEQAELFFRVFSPRVKGIAVSEAEDPDGAEDGAVELEDLR